MNKKNLKLLNEFANNTCVAKGGEINVTIGDGCTSYRPCGESKGMKLEDTNLLTDLIQGATHLIFFLEREGYTIVKRRK